MNAFATLTVRTRLMLSFAVILLLVIAIVAMNIRSMSRIEDGLQEIVTDNQKKVQLVNRMSEQVHIIQRVTRTLVMLADEAPMKDELRKIEAARKSYDEATEILERMPASEAGLALRKKIRAANETTRPLMNQVIALALDNRDAEATEKVLKEAGPAYTRLQDALDENIALQEANTAKDVEAATTTYVTARNASLALGGAVALLAVLIAAFLTRSLTRQLGGEPAYAAEVARRIAGGDLSMSVDIKANDKSSMLAAIKDMQQQLTGIVRDIKGASDTISSATSQISAGNADLSSRTEQQASSLEETASSMEELTGTVKQNAENARQANQLAAGACTMAVKGGEVVGQVVHSMSSINESSKKIADIISVIDGIAFQTNILALNAAVEAARAGEQGRGFAVVASEVRTLAQRSAAAAKEIKGLITDSVAKVEDGSKLVDQAGNTMEEIVSAVKRVTDIMSEIAAASHEQSSGIEQVNQAIVQMDQVTQQNAALVEEAAAAAESMQEQAHNLTNAVAIFKLAGGAAATSPSSPRFSRAEAGSAPSPSNREDGREGKVERRSPNRAKNVARLPKVESKAAAQPTPAKVANSDANWQEF